MTPDLENHRGVPATRSNEELRAYCNQGSNSELARLRALKRALDPRSVFNGPGTLPLV